MYKKEKKKKKKEGFHNNKIKRTIAKPRGILV